MTDPHNRESDLPADVRQAEIDDPDPQPRSIWGCKGDEGDGYEYNEEPNDND